MAEVIWADPALFDLSEIAEYIAIDNYDAASHLVQEVLAAIERLELHPKYGRSPPELERKSVYREIIVTPCRIFYRIEGKKVYILCVMRGERELRVFLLEHRVKENS